MRLEAAYHLSMLFLRPLRLPRPAARAVLAAVCALLSACGGGISIGFGIDDFDRTPPSVSIAASPGSVAPGQPIRLVAAAADENGIDVVGFFRLDNGQAQPLGTLGRPPYELTVTAPTDGRSVVSYFARAIDNIGNRADSARVDVVITR